MTTIDMINGSQTFSFDTWYREMAKILNNACYHYPQVHTVTLNPLYFNIGGIYRKWTPISN